MISVLMNAPNTVTANYAVYYVPVTPPSSTSVGGWSVSLAMQPPLSIFGVYFTLIAASALVLTLRKRRRK
jgi:hypothetical protein